MSPDKLIFKPDSKPFRKPTAKPSGEPRIPAEEIDSIVDFAAKVTDIEQIATPIRIIWRDIEIRILEVTPIPFPNQKGRQYVVTVQFKHRDHLTKPFPIVCEDIVDFIKKLRAEIYRFKSIKFLLPDTTRHL